MRCRTSRGFFRRRPLGRWSGIAVLLAALGCLPAGAEAQSPSGGTSQIPDLSGTWQRTGLTEGTSPAQPECNDCKLHPRAEALRAALDEYASPLYDCFQIVAPIIITDPYLFRIEQQADRVLLEYEKDDVVRTVWLRGHGHQEPRWGEFFHHGYSVGWYEGNQLVVETTRWTPNPQGLDDSTPAIPSSQRKRMMERYWRDGDFLHADVISEDPVMLLEPDRFEYRWELTDAEWLPFECDLEAARAILPFLPPVYEVPIEE